jgi:hypothetical protein
MANISQKATDRIACPEGECCTRAMLGRYHRGDHGEKHRKSASAAVTSLIRDLGAGALTISSRGVFATWRLASG